MKKFLSFFILLILVFPTHIFAYYESAGPEDLRSSVYPSNPGVNQKTIITLGSYLINLNTCNISWEIDGEQSTQRTGQKTFSFTAGKLGQTVSISSLLNCPGRSPLEKNWSFQASDVDFLVSADTYTPPFYRGGSRITSQSSVKITALPLVFNSKGELIKPENLIYKWTKGGKAMPNSSGYGKNTLIVKAGELPGSINFTVEISTISEEIKAIKSLNINIGSPEVIIYENKPLIGLQYQKGLAGNLNLNENETVLTAEPFFFSNADLSNGKISFSWFMNGKSINQSTDGRSVTFRQNTGQTGEATIKLQTKNLDNFFSKAENILKITFGQKTSFLGF